MQWLPFFPFPASTPLHPLLQDRDTRVKKAKTILKFENHTKPDQETPDPASEEGDGEDEAPCTSQQTTTSNVETGRVLLLSKILAGRDSINTDIAFYRKRW